MARLFLRSPRRSLRTRPLLAIGHSTVIKGSGKEIRMGSTQAEVQVSYDVSNEFFRLWLDERMNYTCGVFEGTDNLEEAQVKKLNIIHDYAHLTPDKRVLDIGCGWGANVEFLALDKGVKDVHGVT